MTSLHDPKRKTDVHQPTQLVWNFVWRCHV